MPPQTPAPMLNILQRKSLCGNLPLPGFGLPLPAATDQVFLLRPNAEKHKGLPRGVYTGTRLLISRIS